MFRSEPWHRTGLVKSCGKRMTMSTQNRMASSSVLALSSRCPRFRGGWCSPLSGVLSLVRSRIPSSPWGTPEPGSAACEQQRERLLLVERRALSPSFATAAQSKIVLTNGHVTKQIVQAAEFSGVRTGARQPPGLPVKNAVFDLGSRGIGSRILYHGLRRVL
jgi:hypothetical protein